ncbi:purine permease [Nakamurella flava]|uniref:Purine permease n=1 Tax=Nakamurella flava TaxID=2576308 RepID=A0A4U6QJI0_9ACTN|nr:nucleobase:cation symporter-2 family protein [Nakamurella flava]TKV60620.1 purine permease [Nakamurella flava]
MALSRKSGASGAGTATAERHPVDEVLKPGPMVVYGLQHVMSMYAGVVAVPLIVGTALKLSFSDLSYLLAAALLISGLATLLQTLGVKWIGAKLPIVQGTSFAAVGSMLAIGASAGGGVGGLQAIFGAILVAGLIGFVASGIFSRLLKFFPPVVTGSVITVIGVSLLPVAMRWAAGGAGSPTFGEMGNIGLAAATLLIILLIYRFLPGFFSRVAILMGLVLGTVVAALFGKVDFSRVGEAQWFAVSTPFHFGAPTFSVAAIVSMTIVMLVIMTETTADLLAIGEVVGRPADQRTVANGLRADCIATAASGGLLNGFPVSAFAQNVGLVALTGIRSRFVVAVSGVILLLLGLFPKIGAIVAALPLPVLGGAGLALFGSVAASGIRSLSVIKYEGNQNLVIVGLSVAMGLVPIAIPDFYEHFPTWFQTIFDSGISAAAVTAVLLNILFNVLGRKDDVAPIFVEAPPPGTAHATTEIRHQH